MSLFLVLFSSFIFHVFSFNSNRFKNTLQQQNNNYNHRHNNKKDLTSIVPFSFLRFCKTLGYSSLPQTTIKTIQICVFIMRYSCPVDSISTHRLFFVNGIDNWYYHDNCIDGYIGIGKIEGEFA